jgi:ADP-ribose pyrophosphatase YjhB (NUDIX family)
MSMAGREYPDAPRVGVGAVIVEGDRVLLVQRGNEPGRGLWAIPGGVLELGETVADAVRREIAEETGLEIETGEVAAVVDAIFRDEAARIRFHYVLIDLLARPVGGRLQPASDILDARWTTATELADLPMVPRAREVVLKVLESRG